MKKFSKFAVCAFVLSFAVSAFAGEGRLALTGDAKVNGTLLKAGEYKVQWDNAGSVSILQGKKVVATANAKVDTAAEKNSRNAAVVVKQDDGSKKVIELQFSGKKEVLKLAEGSTSTEVGANSN